MTLPIRDHGCLFHLHYQRVCAFEMIWYLEIPRTRRLHLQQWHHIRLLRLRPLRTPHLQLRPHRLPRLHFAC